MGKLRVYLDTSVISHLLQEDVPEKWLIPDNYGNFIPNILIVPISPGIFVMNQSA